MYAAVTHELKHTALINFVDLAGSERLTKTGSHHTGMRFQVHRATANAHAHAPAPDPAPAHAAGGRATGCWPGRHRIGSSCWCR